MYRLRQWVVRHAAGFERLYRCFEPLLIRLEPLCRGIGYARVEPPVRSVEKVIKGALFDCQMCGQCVLSDTGMACPMNCPKQMRNGPCGGVRSDGRCEVEPEMTCVWVEAWEGSRRMQYGDRIQVVQAPVDHRLVGRSSWLGVIRRRARSRSTESGGGGGSP